MLNNSPALAPLLLLFTGIFVPLAGWKFRRWVYPLAVGGMLAAFTVSLLNWARVMREGTLHYHFGGWIPPIGIEYVLDPLSAFMTAAINGIALVVLIHSARSVEREIAEHRRVAYYALVLLMFCGYNGIMMTGDLFNLYVFLEISSLALYGLIAVGKRKAPVAAFRYLIIGTLGGSFYLLGTGFLYNVTGSLNMADVHAIVAQIGNRPPLITALAFMVVGFGIKMAMFPLHGWLPDAYSYAPSATSSFMAPTGIKIGAYGIVRVVFFVFGFGFVTRFFPVTQVILWLSAAGILYGSIMAVSQDGMKRMLAYSSVSQIGYVGLGIGLANPAGLIGALLHILNHGLMKACLFLAVGNFRRQLGHTRIIHLDDSIRRKMPWTAAAFTVGAMAMIGIPPTVGFFSKWYLALGSIERRGWIFLAVILLSSLLNAAYFFRVIERMYLKQHSPTPFKLPERKISRDEAPLSMLAPTLIFAAALIVFGFLNAWIVKGILTRALPPGF